MSVSTNAIANVVMGCVGAINGATYPPRVWRIEFKEVSHG